MYADSDSVKFVRYINAKAKPLPLPEQGDATSYAYDISLTYFDPSPNDGQADDDLSVVSSVEETEGESEYSEAGDV